METPLLASHPDNEEPSLLSFWPANDDDQSRSSPFARLLEQRAPSLLHWRTTRTIPQLVQENDTEEWKAGYWLLVGSGTASLLHLGFMWGAFASTSWSVTFVTIQTPFATTSLPLLTTHLADILSQFQNVALLGISALVVPCVFMVSAPALILRDAHRPRNWNWKHSYGTSPRSVMECSIRWALFVFYFLIVLQLAVDSMHLHWTGSSVTVHSQAKGGLVAYVTGVASALLALVFLRWPPPQLHNNNNNIGPLAIETAQFEHPLVRTVVPREDETPSMVVLEDTSTLEGPVVSFQPVLHDEIEDNRSLLEGAPWYANLLTPTRLLHKSLFCRTVLIYQLGLFSVVLWIPAYTIPLLQWSSPYLSPNPQPLILWNLPQMLGQSGAAAGTSYWIIGLLGVVLMTTVFVAPAIALGLSITVWCVEPKKSRVCQSWLYAWHPLMGQAVWCMALLLVTPALEPWSRQLLASNTNICQAISTWVPIDDCILLQAEYQPGILLFLVQTVCLEFFVVLTLRWSV
ncbi:hypothetical protein FisN_8Lh322 [Fistulifera solaris]|uniref:Uncharacterized protein n=1 Tax=Fistulifera solaris TaxID=1519565 RepID=A0A1Z5JN22_FISSO|nr:hypothetical protein FisN_8Lh322 [Fistulifera solaris]|eukprot:GAX15384.1 hypothetical protein FisN_8Lh322 [Fistulifera solaris]